MKSISYEERNFPYLKHRRSQVIEKWGNFGELLTIILGFSTNFDQKDIWSNHSVRDGEQNLPPAPSRVHPLANFVYP